MIERIEQLRARGRRRRSPRRASSEALEELRVRYLGRKAELPQMLRGVAELAPEQRGAVGKAANEARQALEALIEQRARASCAAAELEQRLAGGPRRRHAARRAAAAGRAPARAHAPPGASSKTSSSGSASRCMEGPEVETVHYNFDALNHSPTHPARARTDTFYVADDGSAPGVGELVLRTHTSPMQVRAMEAHPPPLYVVIPGRVYRPDSDATHTPQFHQIEGLAVDEDITLADLKGTLLAFARAVFGERARRAPAPALLPLHRAQRRGRRLLLSLLRQGLPARRRALLPVQGRGLARGARRRRGRPERLLPRAHHRAQRARL